jgi:predicted metal-binding membrane protein
MPHLSLTVDEVLTTTRSVRKRLRLGYVPQELFLLHDSVRINVSLGDPELSDADVQLAMDGFRRAHPWAPGSAIFLLAGVYQFTPWKYACLDKCRSPMSFLVQHWGGKRAGADALRLGFHHGAYCVGCCWSLMLLMFAVATGGLGWMLLLGIVMAAEKNLPWGRRLSAPLGVVLIVASVGIAVAGR